MRERRISHATQLVLVLSHRLGLLIAENVVSVERFDCTKAFRQRLHGGLPETLASERVEEEIRLEERKRRSSGCYWLLSKARRNTHGIVQLKENDGYLREKKVSFDRREIAVSRSRSFRDVDEHGWRCK